MATVTFAGSVSVNANPLCGGLPVPLVSVNVSVEVPLTPIGLGLDTLVSATFGLTTVFGAFPVLLLVLDSVCPLNATVLLLVKLDAAFASMATVTVITG